LRRTPLPCSTSGIAAVSGGEKPTMEVPESLIARRQACAEASESAAAAASAREVLSKELAAAKAALADAERSVREAALTVLLAEAERIAARLDLAKRESWRLASVLNGLDQLRLPSGADQAPRPVRSPQVQAALDAQEPQYPPLENPETKYAAAWRAYHTALLADPEATLEGAP
jgi:hypothetical protein